MLMFALLTCTLLSVDDSGTTDGAQHIFLMRHGKRLRETMEESEWMQHHLNYETRSWDTPLADDGYSIIKGAAHELADEIRDAALKKITRIVVSPLRRCIQTAQHAQAVLKERGFNTELSVDDGIMEFKNVTNFRNDRDYPALLGNSALRDHGAQTEMPRDAILTDDQIAEGYNGDFDGVAKELITRSETMEKTDDGLHTLEEYTECKIRLHREITRIAARYPGENILLVTHKDAVTAMASAAASMGGVSHDGRTTQCDIHFRAGVEEDTEYCCTAHIGIGPEGHWQLMQWLRRGGRRDQGWINRGVAWMLSQRTNVFGDNRSPLGDVTFDFAGASYQLMQLKSYLSTLSNHVIDSK